MSEEIQILNTNHGTRIAWMGNLTPHMPTVVFFVGHGSDMHGTKAIAVAEWAMENNYGIIRFDYFGHGQSSGNLLDGNLSIWKKDCLAVIDQLTDNSPLIIVGSSLGGWLMLLAAAARPNRIAGLIGIAAAPDFTEDLIWNQLSPSQQQAMKTSGHIAFDNPYSKGDKVVYPYQLILDGRKNLFLKQPMDADYPIRLLHGMKDNEVPPKTAEKIAANINASDIEVTLVQEAGHRFSAPD